MVEIFSNFKYRFLQIYWNISMDILTQNIGEMKFDQLIKMLRKFLNK